MKKTDFSKAVTSYLAEYLPQTCGFSDNTINSYRDAFKLLLLFLQEEKGIEAHKIELKMIGRQIVSEFLDWLENTRNASVSTRNQRLAALKAFSKYAQYRYPDTITNCVDIITMRPKKQEKPLVAYLSEEELSVLLKQPNPMILHEVDAEDMKRFLDLVRSADRYEWVVFAVGNTLCGCEQIFVSAERIFHLSGNGIANSSVRNAWLHFIRQCQGMKEQEIEQIPAMEICGDSYGSHLIYEWLEGAPGRLARKYLEENEDGDGSTLAGN